MLCYQVTNTITGKVYIGLTTLALAARWKLHVAKAISGQGYALHDAMRKHGIENFLIEEVAAPVIQDRDELAELERILIAQAGSIAPGGYNLTTGGDGVSGCEETRKKIGDAKRGTKHTEATRARMKASAVGRINGPQSAETRAKISASNKGKVKFIHTAESKEKCRLAGLRRTPIPMSDELKARLVAIHTGKKHSEETREKMRQSHARRLAAKKQTEALLGAVFQSIKEVK